MSERTISLRDHSAGYVVRRLSRSFARRASMSKWGVQYRLCETGPIRLDPRLLFATIATLGEGNRAPWTPKNSILVDPTLDAHTANELAEAALLDAKGLMVGTTGPDRTDIARALALHATRHTPTDDAAINGTTRLLAGDVELTTLNELFDHRARGRNVLVWFTYDLEWLYPDNADLWELVHQTAKAGTRLMIVARKIAPATFHVLRAVGARGVQYYGLISADDPTNETRRVADSLGLPPLLSVDHLSVHQMTLQLNENLRFLTSPPSNTLASETAVNAALECGLVRNEPITPERLRAWSAKSPGVWPPIWFDILDAWDAVRSTTWSATSLQAATSLSSGPHLAPPSDESERPAAPDLETYRTAAEVDRNTWDRLVGQLKSPTAIRKSRRW
jgi:hypothetical protein